MLILKRRTELPPFEGQTSHLSAPINFYLYQLHSVFTIIRVVAVAVELYAAHAILMPSILQDSTPDVCKSFLSPSLCRPIHSYAVHSQPRAEQSISQGSQLNRSLGGLVGWLSSRVLRSTATIIRIYYAALGSRDLGISAIETTSFHFHPLILLSTFLVDLTSPSSGPTPSSALSESVVSLTQTS